MVGTDGINLHDRSRSARWRQRRCGKRIDRAVINDPAPRLIPRDAGRPADQRRLQHRRGFRQRGDENFRLLAVRRSSGRRIMGVSTG